ncbi:Uncharacterised protein [Shigella sonnei]|nr:Uncharacterised protein [Shigella sonnei]CSF68343.1 Uncharacterised protein [Shigella sonnei]CSG21266.1 Uncharacterised protein [Shigella sonnei]CSG35411.1 Uncharacterised protein [Shigella sonnei]CSH75587.1 Uncharacterised protein [Shigella sonnei]
MNIGTGFLCKAHHIKLFQRCNLPTNNLRIVDPHRAAKFSGQTQQIFGGEIGIGAEQ